MLDDNYGGLLMGDQSSFMRESMTTNLSSTNPSSFISASNQAYFEAHRIPVNTTLPAPSGFKPMQQKMWSQAQSPSGDVDAKSYSKMPQMKGHHEFNPKEASTLLMVDESRSFYGQSKEEVVGVTNKHIQEMILKQAVFDSNFDESRPSDGMPSLQMIQTTDRSFLPDDQSNIMVKPSSDASFVREVQNLGLSIASQQLVGN